MKGCPVACSFDCQNLTRLVCHKCGPMIRVCVSHVESQVWSDHVQQCSRSITPDYITNETTLCGNSSSLVHRLESALSELHGWSTRVEFDGFNFGKAMFTDDPFSEIKSFYGMAPADIVRFLNSDAPIDTERRSKWIVQSTKKMKPKFVTANMTRSIHVVFACDHRGHHVKKSITTGTSDDGYRCAIFSCFHFDAIQYMS
jgi:hypothetical protein